MEFYHFIMIVYALLCAQQNIARKIDIYPGSYPFLYNIKYQEEISCKLQKMLLYPESSGCKKFAKLFL